MFLYNSSGEEGGGSVGTWAGWLPSDKPLLETTSAG